MTLYGMRSFLFPFVLILPIMCCHFLLPCGAPLCDYVAIYYHVPWLTHVKIVFNLRPL